MGKEVPISHFNKQDFKAFEKRLQEETGLLRDWFAQQVFADKHDKGGFELEAWLVDRQCRPAPINETFLSLCDDPMVVAELSNFNIEFNGTPHILQGKALRIMQDELTQRWNKSNDVAAGLEAQLLMIGILPTVNEQQLVLENMSRMERYRALNEQVMRLRQGRPLRLDIQGQQHLQTSHKDVMLEAATTSFQIHLQLGSNNALRLFNAASIVSAPMVAVSANSPYLFGTDLWDETRIPVFEQAIALHGHDSAACEGVRRISFGTDYVQQSLYECFEQNLQCYPVLLPVCFDQDHPGGAQRLEHLRLHNGTIWRWNRPLIGFDAQGKPHMRLEHRVVAAGPTIIDCMANAALFYGLVHGLAAQDDAPETQLGFSRARKNFYAAAKNGLRAEITWLKNRTLSVQALLLEELLPMARNGLTILGIAGDDIDEYLGIIEARARTMQNGAGWQRAYINKYNCDMQAMTAAYQQRQQSGVPVHEWSL